MSKHVLITNFIHKQKKKILTKTIKLNEEVGELCNDILSVLKLQRKSKLQKFDKRNFYEEFADVLITTIQLASVANVDVERALDNKLKKIEVRYSTCYQEPVQVEEN